MRYTRNLISLFILTVLMGAGFLVLGTGQANAFCPITINKAAIPPDDTIFTFEVTGDQNFSFTLSDPSDDTELMFIENGNEVSLTELVPPGWELGSIECTVEEDDCGGGPCLFLTEFVNEQRVAITCVDDGVGSCTFSNSGPRPIPTLSQWGFIAMAGILVLVGIWGITRKKAEA